MSSNYLRDIEGIVEVGESFKLHVTGFSMLPLLGYGRDNILIRRIDAEEDITGRIAMFRTADGHIVVHRVVKVENGNVTLQGYGNPYKRELCRRSEIIGVVESVERENGREESCTTRHWLRKESIWLHLPAIVRHYTLGIMRKWLRWRRKK